MGLNASSDKRCCKSDIIVDGLTWAKRLVDDTIIRAKDEDKLISRTRIVLNLWDTLSQKVALNQTKRNSQQSCNFPLQKQ